MEGFLTGSEQKNWRSRVQLLFANTLVTDLSVNDYRLDMRGILERISIEDAAAAGVARVGAAACVGIGVAAAVRVRAV